MRRSILSSLCVLALVGLPVGGCGDEGTRTGGSGGSGGGGGGTGGSPVSCEGTVCPCSEGGILAAITQGGGTYTFACDGPTTVVTEAVLVVDNDVILDGEGNLTLDGNDAHELFSVPSGVTVELGGLTLTRGLAGGRVGFGGGIFNQGTLTLSDTTVTENRSTGGSALWNEGTLTVTNSTIVGNDGGGIGNGGTLTVTNSTVAGIGGSSPMSTIAVNNSTIVGDAFGGVQDSSKATLANTLIRGSCTNIVTSLGYNLESTGNTCGFAQPTDQVNVNADDLKLGPLADNGGPTETHSLLPGSVAIDVIPGDACEVDTDQRGVARPQGAACDVGAFEL